MTPGRDVPAQNCAIVKPLTAWRRTRSRQSAWSWGSGVLGTGSAPEKGRVGPLNRLPDPARLVISDAYFNNTVTLTIDNNPGGATLGGLLSVAAQSGVATFSGLTLDQAGDGYTLQIASNGLTAATTDAFSVDAPTIFTVDLTSSSGAGSGDAGDLVYVIGLANANTNPGGSEIQFDPNVFGSPQTITPSTALVLSETAGPEAIEGPGANLVTVSGSDAIEVFNVGSGVTATLTGLTISGGSDQLLSGGGIYNAGTLTVAYAAIDNNSTDTTAAQGGGVDNVGALAITSSSIDGNSSAYGGGIWNSIAR